MLNKNEILKEIKKLMKFGDDTMNYIDAKSGDNIVRVNGTDFTIGAELFLVTPNGLIPAPEGQHTLDDGRTLTVSGGKITDIQEAPQEEDTNLEEGETVVIEAGDMTAPTTTDSGDTSGSTASMTPEQVAMRLVECEKKITDMEQVINEMAKAYGTHNMKLQEKLDQFIKSTPAEAPFQSLKSEYKNLIKERKTTEMTSLEKLREIRLKK